MNDAKLPSRRIIVVDDTPASSYLLARLLEAMGQSVNCCLNAADALVAASKEIPQLVISDLSMPGMDGYQFARVLRGEPQFRGIILAALSGLSNDEDRQRALESGFDHFLVKPVGVAELRALLDSLPLE